MHISDISGLSTTIHESVVSFYSLGNYLIKRQQVCAYISAHCRLHRKSLWSVWEITYLRLCKLNILMLGHAVARTVLWVPVISG